MFTMQYLTGSGWQWITYNNMMPVGRTLDECRNNFQGCGWKFLSSIQVENAGHKFQFRIVVLS